MSSSGNICASIFLVVSMLFILTVHVNGFVFQVAAKSNYGYSYYIFSVTFQIPEEPLFLILYLPLPVLFTFGSVIWLWKTYKGAVTGGYPIYVEDLISQQRAFSNDQFEKDI